MLKILQVSNTCTVNFLMFKLVLEKAEEPEIKLPTSAGSWKKQESSRKTSISTLLTMPKPLTVWITMSCGNSFPLQWFKSNRYFINLVCWLMNKKIITLNKSVEGKLSMGFPGSTSGKEPTCQFRRCKQCRSDPWVRMIPWRRAWQLQYSCLQNPTDRGDWWATVHRVAKSQT